MGYPKLDGGKKAKIPLKLMIQGNLWKAQLRCGVAQSFS